MEICLQINKTVEYPSTVMVNARCKIIAHSTSQTQQSDKGLMYVIRRDAQMKNIDYISIERYFRKYKKCIASTCKYIPIGRS